MTGLENEMSPLRKDSRSTSNLEEQSTPVDGEKEFPPHDGFQETCGAPLKGLRGCKPLKTPSTLRTSRVRVVDHVQKYDKLHLRPATSKVIRSPLKFQRTPVYQCVKRINSYMKRQIVK